MSAIDTAPSIYRYIAVFGDLFFSLLYIIVQTWYFQLSYLKLLHYLGIRISVKLPLYDQFILNHNNASGEWIEKYWDTSL